MMNYTFNGKTGRLYMESEVVDKPESNDFLLTKQNTAFRYDEGAWIRQKASAEQILKLIRIVEGKDEMNVAIINYPKDSPENITEKIETWNSRLIQSGKTGQSLYPPAG